MRVTQWGEYATHFCIFLAQQELSGAKSVSAAQFAKSQEIDQLYAQQILQRLRKSNIIESIRGAQGGYRLTRASTQITLKDILRAAEGDTFEVICETKPINNTRCEPGNFCSLRNVWTGLKGHIDSFLETKKLSELAIEHPIQDIVSEIGSKKNEAH